MPLRDDLLTPIAGENPSGPSLRYDPVYDKIKEARREDDDAPQGDWQRERKSADFKLVIKLAGDAIATRSKDLQLAAWLTEASLRREGFSGLLEGITLLHGLVSEFWETVHPEIEDGDLEMRAAPLEWVGTYLEMPVRKTGITKSGLSYFKYKESRTVGYEEQAAENESKRTAREAAVADGKATAEDFDAASSATSTDQYGAWVAALDGSMEALDSLGELCNEKFEDFAPSFSKLRNALEEVRQVVNSIWQKRLDQEGRPPAAEEAPEEDAAEAEQTYQPVSTSGGAAAAPARARKTVAGLDPADADEAVLRLGAVAKYLRQADGYSPAPYLLLRGFRWGELRGYGAEPHYSVLAAPATETRQQIKQLFMDRSFAEMLEAAETAMAEPCGRAWLDLQRFVVRACEQYGYPAIAAAIKSEVKALIADLPELPNWTLADDTPTANGETKAWLNEFAHASNGASAVTTQTHSMRTDEPEETAAESRAPDMFELAMEQVRSGRAREGIEMLSADIYAQPSGRGRFQRKLQLAQLCLATGHEAVAQPILEQLTEMIDRHSLEEWEAVDTVAHPLAMLYRCLAKAEVDPEELRKLYARICRLDPVQALACGR